MSVQSANEISNVQEFTANNSPLTSEGAHDVRNNARKCRSATERNTESTSYVHKKQQTWSWLKLSNACILPTGKPGLGMAVALARTALALAHTLKSRCEQHSVRGTQIRFIDYNRFVVALSYHDIWTQNTSCA